jgi:uncharacterized membrane protein YraQ (UPF0718 family)
MGLAGIVISAFVFILYGICIAAVIWIILTLNRIRKVLEAIQNRLETVEQSLKRT